MDLDVELERGLGPLLHAAGRGDKLLLPAEYYTAGSAKFAAFRRRGRYPFGPVAAGGWDTPGTITVGNYFVAASQGNPALGRLIETVVAALRRYPRTLPRGAARDPHQFADLHTFLTTGPDLLTSWYYGGLRMAPNSGALAKGTGAVEADVFVIADDNEDTGGGRQGRVGSFGRHLVMSSWKPKDEGHEGGYER